MTSQFAEFGGDDGKDHRRELMRLLAELGRGLPPHMADQRRAEFLRSLLPHSESCFAHLPALIAPCNAVRAYLLLVQITGVLGVRIGTAARLLERFARKGVQA